jgi:hypothetical protein
LAEVRTKFTKPLTVFRGNDRALLQKTRHGGQRHIFIDYIGKILLAWNMFQCSADQTQWFHLFRVQKAFPTIYILFACGDAEVEGVPSQVLDLRIISRDQSAAGGSWWVKKEGKTGKCLTRADISKFLELQAKFQIANSTKRGIDEIELIESSHDELALAVSIDDGLKNNLESIRPTIFSKLARNLIMELKQNQTGFEFEELPDWLTRNET